MDKPESITYMLKSALKGAALPGIVGAVVRLDRNAGKSSVVAKGAFGLRKAGGNFKLRENDLMRLGGCTMPFVATVIAMLVDQGKLRWSDSIYNLLCESGVPVILDHYKFATLEMLVQHRAGLPADLYPKNPKALSAFLSTSALTAMQQREQYVIKALSAEPVVHSGIYNYSHAGYIVAAYIAETVTGHAFEDLLRTMLLEPLNLQPYALGPLSKVAGEGEDSAPVGHVHTLDEESQSAYVPFTNSLSTDRGQHYNSAGGLSMTMESLAKFVMWHIQGDLGLLSKNSCPKQSTFLLLHNHFAGGAYAHGWVHHPEVPYLIFHDGMVEGFTTMIAGFYNYDIAVALSTNCWHYDEALQDQKTCKAKPLEVLETLAWQLARRYTQQRVLPLPANLANSTALVGGSGGVMAVLARDLRAAEEVDQDEPVLPGLEGEEEALEREASAITFAPE